MPSSILGFIRDNPGMVYAMVAPKSGINASASEASVASGGSGSQSSAAQTVNAIELFRASTLDKTLLDSVNMISESLIDYIVKALRPSITGADSLLTKLINYLLLIKESKASGAVVLFLTSYALCRAKPRSSPATSSPATSSPVFSWSSVGEKYSGMSRNSHSSFRLLCSMVIDLFLHTCIASDQSRVNSRVLEYFSSISGSKWTSTGVNLCVRILPLVIHVLSFTFRLRPRSVGMLLCGVHLNFIDGSTLSQDESENNATSSKRTALLIDFFTLSVAAMKYFRDHESDFKSVSFKEVPPYPGKCQKNDLDVDGRTGTRVNTQALSTFLPECDDPLTCPMCRSSPCTRPVLLTTGRVLCLRCAENHVGKTGTCPFTGIRIGPTAYIKLKLSI